MCGRFTLTSPPTRLRDRFRLAAVPDALVAHYNIAPSQPVLVIANRSRRLLRPARWGLVPGWAMDPSIGHRLINARAETLARRPAFRGLLERQRCVVPADGFYEWRRAGRGGRQAFYLRARDGEPLALAGLWDVWRAANGEPLASCTIITVPANGVVAPIHDRMPAVLSAAAVDAWLDPAPAAAAALAPLLAPAPDEHLIAIPVSSRVNKPEHDDPSCIAPLPERA
ncbi:SOS response-associated peptidase [bacterium]|nr:SOS response-associated peptidase [bacterium]